MRSSPPSSCVLSFFTRIDLPSYGLWRYAIAFYYMRRTIQVSIYNRFQKLRYTNHCAFIPPREQQSLIYHCFFFIFCYSLTAWSKSIFCLLVKPCKNTKILKCLACDDDHLRIEKRKLLHHVAESEVDYGYLLQIIRTLVNQQENISAPNLSPNNQTAHIYTIEGKNIQYAKLRK